MTVHSSVSIRNGGSLYDYVQYRIKSGNSSNSLSAVGNAYYSQNLIGLAIFLGLLLVLPSFLFDTC